MMFFKNKTINDHATEATQKLRKIGSDFSSNESPLDTVTGIRRGRVAKSVMGGRDTHQDRLKKVQDRKPFWKIAPDGKTILCNYDPDQEPIIELGERE
jgi:hypothetical protein